MESHTEYGIYHVGLGVWFAETVSGDELRRMSDEAQLKKPEANISVRYLSPAEYDR